MNWIVGRGWLTAATVTGALSFLELELAMTTPAAASKTISSNAKPANQISLFDFRLETPSNYDKYDEFFAALEDCAELRDNLASFYYKSPDNGMPWGIWNPKYQPVGVCKRKPINEHNFTKVENKRQ